jgi:Glycosyltransferase family 87
VPAPTFSRTTFVKPTTRISLGLVAASLPAGALAVASTGSVDYGAGMKTGDSPLPAITALLRGDLAGMAHQQPVIGLTSILWRGPFVALASIFSSRMMLGYQFGVFACALVVGWLGAVVASKAHARGQPWPVALGAVTLMVLSPLTIGARLGGHPEELLAGALCVGAVLAALDDRPLLAGALLGLALGTKQWTPIAAVPVFVACRAGRLRMLAVAAAVGAPLALALPLADPAAFSSAAKLIGNLNEVSMLSWWFPFSASHTVTVQVIGGPATATSHLLPFGLTRTKVVWLIPAVAVLVGWCFHRSRADRDPADALGLLALLVLLRCTLDPSNVSYYHVPFVIALLAWETITRRGLPLISLLTIAGIWGLEYHVFTTTPLVLGYATMTIGLTTYLAVVVLRGRSHRRDLDETVEIPQAMPA